MTRFVKVRKARKTYICFNNGTFAHDPTIRPGDTYARVETPPSSGKGSWGKYELCDYCWECERGEHA